MFIGRERELARLETLHKKQTPGLVVVKGRRRIGKSRLIAEFASKHPKNTLWSFSGLAPQDGMSAQSQRDHFARQLATRLNTPPFTFQDWSDAFDYLNQHLSPGDIVLFDEISWMGAHDPSFISKLKAWWDQQTISIVMVFCGSVSTWIEENILKSTAFFGRINFSMTLEPLTIPESARLLRASKFQGSTYDIYKILRILGGIPWYLEQISPGQTADELIKQLCFEKKWFIGFRI
ncbi:MAG: ATP-binding protein [Legionellaceae bacterium]|nr:ATP-binding protein [Legionellaceae bacterium]